MSLQVWLPLTKDLRNQGLDNITVTTANTNNFQNEGKLSNKSLDVSGHYAFRVPSLVKKRVFSCAFWYKPITDNSLSDNWRRIIVFDTYTSDGSTAGAIFRFESSYGYQSSSTTYCISIHNNVGEPIASIGTGLGETDGWNKWQHIAITADGTTLKCYRNGVQVASGNMNNGGMLQGTVHIGYSGNRPIGRLNDFRLYDHALSQTEIKEIAKGLILHYPLSDRYIEGTTNLVTSITQGGQTTWSNNILTTSGTNADTYFTLNLSESIVNGTQYTISCDAEDIPSGTCWSFPLGQQSNTTLLFQIYNGHNEYTFTANNISWGTNRCFMDDGGSPNSARYTGVPCKLYNFQIEKKDHATAFAGYGGTRTSSIVYDCSGFCNNGTTSGIFTISNDTPRYNASTKFTTEPNAITSVSDFSNLNIFTYNCWIKASAAQPAFLLMGYQYGNNTSGSLALDSSGKGGFHYYAHTGGQGDVTIGSSTNCCDNKWHMITATYDGSKIITYLDGVKTAEGTVTLLTTSRIFSLNYPSGASGRYFNGLMSDARVYATALSAEDVLELYHTAARIDNVGNTYVYQYIET